MLLRDWVVRLGKLEKTPAQPSPVCAGHTLPISVSECERSFSSAKFTLNPLRACMKFDLFEGLETLRAWFLKDGVEDDKGESGERGTGGYIWNAPVIGLNFVWRTGFLQSDPSLMKLRMLFGFWSQAWRCFLLLLNKYPMKSLRAMAGSPIKKKV